MPVPDVTIASTLRWTNSAAISAARSVRPSAQRLAAVRFFHRAAGYETPTSDEKVKAVLSGIRRTIGAAPVRKRAATADIVIAMSPTATSLRALRNRAIILLGFAGAFRRSELVALNVDDLEETAEGMLVTLHRSKTDQEGLGRRVAIPRGEIACHPHINPLIVSEIVLEARHRARASKTARLKEERKKERGRSLCFCFSFFLFFNWIRCIPPLPPERGAG
jgi:integrase